MQDIHNGDIATQRKLANKRTQTPLLPSAVRAVPEIEPALMRLCSMKNQANFTPHQIETWGAALSVFEVRDVNHACLQLGLSSDPFPDLGKVMLAAENARRKRKAVSGSVVENIPVAQTVPDRLLVEVAAAMELEV